MSEDERPAGWLPDPLGRYDHRYWDGRGWTDQVAKAGEQATDPAGVEPSPPVTAVQPSAPSAAWAPPTPPPARRAAWPWALAAGLVAFAIGVGGCVAVSVIVTDRVTDELRERRDLHAITVAEYEAIELGMTREEVIEALGKEPESSSEVVSEVGSERSEGWECLLYLEEGQIFFPVFELCFDDDGILVAKSAR